MPPRTFAGPHGSKRFYRHAALAAALAIAYLQPSHAQQQPAPAPAPPLAPPVAPPAPQAQPQQFQSSDEWGKLPRMQLERQFAGPLQDTVIQRWRDPIDGTVCYIYLPISVAHSPTTASGFVQYGSNGIGSINCQPAQKQPATAAAPAGRK